MGITRVRVMGARHAALTPARNVSSHTRNDGAIVLYSCSLVVPAPAPSHLLAHALERVFIVIVAVQLNLFPYH